MWKVRFYFSKKVRCLLVEETRNLGTEDPTNDLLFQIAYNSIITKGYQRVEEFNANYAFSRSMVIGLFAFLVKYAIILPNASFALLACLITWYRTKQRGFYFAREVLNIYLTK